MQNIIGQPGQQITITLGDALAKVSATAKAKKKPHCQTCDCHAPAKVAKATPQKKSKKPQISCLCGCGEITNPGRKFRTGHDARHKRDMAKADSGVTDYSFLTPAVAAGLRTLIANGQGDEIIGGVTGHKITDILAMAEAQG